jgi:membrane associated rhomboid family serine protease
MVIFLIILTVLVSWQGFQNRSFLERMLFIPYRIKHNEEWPRFFSHMLVHSDWSHLIFNMMTLYFIGDFLFNEYSLIFGSIKGIYYFGSLYLMGGLFATAYSYYKHQNNPGYRSLGASGAVTAVLFAFIAAHPTQDLMLMFIPIPIPAYIFGPIYLLIEYYAFRKGNTGIAHDAHISGALVGILFVLFFIPGYAQFFASLFQ